MAIDEFYGEICRDEEKLLDAASSTTGPGTANQAVSSSSQNSMSLMKNVFGNYVIQLIFQRGSEERVEQFYQCILDQIHDLTFDQFGCRII